MIAKLVSSIISVVGRSTVEIIELLSVHKKSHKNYNEKRPNHHQEELMKLIKNSAELIGIKDPQNHFLLVLESMVPNCRG